ncbi:hypothetical protein [Endozoicomonas sp. 8E]|uniref:hypothetical protein n=1 Tax=Endozoicomonas sp. 8E TaxID=3035692 RepID=UPI0029391DB3|nr:hypothetical protein [Endozoicomonas sp. 8E]WOG29595.1 hypothetical protein P6910_08065 [Endozoicomonas sp. 8E]
MSSTRQNVLSLAVAVAISSCIINTEALAARKLQTKSAWLLDNGGSQYTRSEVMVQPTLGDDQQPIPKSFTTTYPYAPSENDDYSLPTIGISFTEALYGIGNDGVSSVDQYETGENDVAQKYTKVLKVDGEGIFRFTHNLAEEELVIEVRGGMTRQDSIEFIRELLDLNPSLEPLTKIATPLQLADMLEAVSTRAGILGSSDHYLALATIEVEKVAVDGRTFMRLIASGDQPPELHRLGQSLFVNDEALLAAAASAYIQVHILGEDLQQQALNELLALNKPVGYVVHVEDDTQVYPVPAGYPKLEITEAPGEEIVFHGQMTNPHDVAFVENLYKLWVQAGGNNPAPAVITELQSSKIKSYEFVIRSRQMALLEEFVARHDAGVNKVQPTMLAHEDKLAARSLAYYESLQQALALAAPDEPYGRSEFEFTLEHIRVASLVITPTRMYKQLAKHFDFKPVLGNLLKNPQFFQNIRKVIPVIGDINEAQIDSGKDEEFTSKVMIDMARQLLELHNNLEQQRAKKTKLKNLNRELLRVTAEELGIDNWANLLPREQVRLISKKIQEIKRASATTLAATEQPDYEIITAKLEGLEDLFGITADNENDLVARFQSVQQHIRHKMELDDGEAPQRLDNMESELGLTSDEEAAPEARHKAILKHLEQQEALVQRHLQITITDPEKAAAEESVGLKSDVSDTNKQRINALRNRQAGMKASVTGMKEYAAAVIANYVLDDIAFDNGRRTATFLTHVQDTLTPYANVAGLSESDFIKIIHGTLIQAHAAAVERQLLDYWIKPSAFLLQAVTWYYSSYKPLLATHTTLQAAELSLSNMSFLYLLDLTNRADYLHRMLTPFQHWLERYGIDLDRASQYACHSGIEQISEVGGLAMPLGKAASSVILLKTGSALFTRQYNANPQRYRSISRMVPEIMKSMGSGQGVQIPLLHRVTPQKVKILASATAGLVLGPVATVGTYAHGLLSGFTYAQTFGFALASSLTFDFFMNDNKMLTQWLGGPLGRSLDKINRWTGLGETDDEYLKRTAIARPQSFDETDTDYANRVKANNTLYGWTRHENYLQFRERRDRTMKLFENGWEKYFRENLPKWSFSHAESIPYFYTLGAFYE